MFLINKLTQLTDKTRNPKHRSTLNSLFNPDLGASLRPLGESFALFTRLIALVFAMNGLFPKTHPALFGRQPAPPLTLGGVILTAWRYLRFDAAHIPQIILFVAVVGSIIFGVVFLVVSLMAAFTGTAHAQGFVGGDSSSSSLFAPISPSQDIAQNFIDYLFRGQPLSNSFLGLGAGQSLGTDNALPCALMTALGVYSQAMLVFAGFILFYHLTSMIAHTAHDGKVMGERANQIWAPIRLVFAIGLLVPVGSVPSACNSAAGVGLNSGQYIVIKMAEMGSGLASHIWSQFLTSMAKQYTYIPPPPQDVSQMVRDMALMEACRYSENYRLYQVNQNFDATVADAYIGGNFDPITYLAPTGLVPKEGTDAWTYYYGNNIEKTHSVCGYFKLPKPPAVADTSSTGQTIAQSTIQTYNSVFLGDLQDFADLGGMIAYSIDGNPLHTGAPIPNNTLVANEVAKFQQDMDSALDQTMANNSSGSLAAKVEQFANYGWVTAGAWLNTIANNQAQIIDASVDGLPEIHPPSLSGKPYLIAFEGWLDQGAAYVPVVPTVPNPMALSAPCGLAGGVAAGSVSYGMGANGSIAPLSANPQKFGTAIGVPSDLTEIDSPYDAPNYDAIDRDLQQISQLAQDNHLWDDGKCNAQNRFVLGHQLQSSNPFAEISDWGIRSMITAKALMKSIWKDSVALAKLESQINMGRFYQSDIQGISGANAPVIDFNVRQATWKVSIRALAALAFFTCGFTVAFVVPLMPFFRFFFNVLTWLVSVLEAVVAVPLIALAHLDPEGAGLPGNHAKASYFMVFNLFLRPVMMVFGLVCGLILFVIALVLLNATYALAVDGTNAVQSSGNATVVRLVFTLMYGATVYVLANNCFKPIGMFPQFALSWIGKQGHHESMGDGGNTVRGVMGQAQSLGGQKAIDSAKFIRGGGI